jgi:HD-GYP domain-containing protein (c-di-GMP phosphodiesterase class II)
MAKKIPIEDIKIGMVFSKPLYTGENNTLIPALVPIKEADYNRLIRWGVKELLTEGELVEEVIPEKDEFDFKTEDIEIPEYINKYYICLNLFSEVADTYIKNGEFEKNKLEDIIDKIIELVKNHKNDILSYMGIENEEFGFIITHSINSTIIALIGQEQLKLDPRQIRSLAMAGLLHDIGMLKIPQAILNKTDKLTDEEYNLIKSHPIIAYKDMNKGSLFNQSILDAVLQHQEQFDGNGYPRKLKGDKVGLFAKILAVADTFEAQISPRAYRKSKSGYMAMKSVLAEAKNKFDPDVLRSFLTTLSIYPPGTVLQLNNNSIGSVISVNPNAPLRPVVKIIVDEFGEKIDENVIKDLKEEQDLFIVRVLNKEEYKK